MLTMANLYVVVMVLLLSSKGVAQNSVSVMKVVFIGTIVAMEQLRQLQSVGRHGWMRESV
jgi:hypothetical protein